MNMQPGAVYHSSCSSVTSKPLERYHPPRIAVGPDTKQIRVNIDRAIGAGFETQKDLTFVMRVEDKTRPGTMMNLNSSGYANYQAIFGVAGSGLFTTKGLHYASIYHNDCCVGQIEVVFAPPLYVNGAVAAESTCGEDAGAGWVEPACTDPDTCDRPREPAACDKTCNVDVPIRQGYGT